MRWTTPRRAPGEGVCGPAVRVGKQSFGLYTKDGGGELEQVQGHFCGSCGVVGALSFNVVKIDHTSPFWVLGFGGECRPFLLSPMWWLCSITHQ